MSRLWFRVLVLIIGALSLKMPARAYEGDHYVWTYYLARHCGYTHRQAFQIASAAYAIDFDPNTGPMPEGFDWVTIASGIPTVHQRKWTEFHAFTLNQLKPEQAQIAKNQAADAAADTIGAEAALALRVARACHADDLHRSPGGMNVRNHIVIGQHLWIVRQVVNRIHDRVDEVATVFEDQHPLIARF